MGKGLDGVEWVELLEGGLVSSLVLKIGNILSLGGISFR